MPYNLLVLMTAISMVTCNESIINNKCKGNCVVQTFSNVPQKSSLIQILFKKILVWFFISLVLRLSFHLAFYPLKIVWHFGASFTTQLNILWGINHLLNNVYHFLCKNNQAITSSLCTLISSEFLEVFYCNMLLSISSSYLIFIPMVAISHPSKIILTSLLNSLSQKNRKSSQKSRCSWNRFCTFFSSLHSFPK